jgi:hypothetical protein
MPPTFVAARAFAHTSGPPKRAYEPATGFRQDSAGSLQTQGQNPDKEMRNPDARRARQPTCADPRLQYEALITMQRLFLDLLIIFCAAAIAAPYERHFAYALARRETRD